MTTFKLIDHCLHVRVLETANYVVSIFVRAFGEISDGDCAYSQYENMPVKYVARYTITYKTTVLVEEASPILDVVRIRPADRGDTLLIYEKYLRPYYGKDTLRMAVKKARTAMQNMVVSKLRGEPNSAAARRAMRQNVSLSSGPRLTIFPPS